MSLRPIVSKGYSQTRGSNIWRTEVQGGLPRQGRDTYFEPVPISVTLVVSSLGRQAFYSFLNNIDGGASSFIMPHDTGMGIEDHKILITSTINDSTDDGKNWAITFTATAERTAIQEDTCLTKNLPDLFGCYGDCLGGFLKAYGAAQSTFPRIWINEGPAGYPPINLLASTLDSRIVYDGPQVYYVNRNGNLVQSATNEWPLTFIDGVAVGRVPPEKAATNYQLYSRTPHQWSNISRMGVKESEQHVYIDSTGIECTPTTDSGEHFLLGRWIGASNVKIGSYLTSSVVVKSNGAGFVQLYWSGGATGISSRYSNFDLNNCIASGTAASSYIADLGGGWFYCSSSVLAGGDGSVATSVGVAGIVSLSSSMAPSYSGDGVSSFIIASSQVEQGALSTSPIITDSYAVIRPSASAKVVMSRAASIDITYSDGSVVNVQAVGDYATIPQADSAWGSKYITRIDFNMDG